MKITRIETVWIDEQPNTMWVRLHTDDGLIGLGETFYVPRGQRHYPRCLRQLVVGSQPVGY